jgi:APA family basic amino acid/polyamine antiporter
LMINLPAITWWRFLIWTIAGVVLYFMYGMWHSVLRKQDLTPPRAQD